MNPVAHAALQYIGKGIPVFPCDDNKKPLTRNGFLNATTDPNQVLEWFGIEEPPLLAIPTGKASDLWVLDIDVKEGKDGTIALDGLEARNGKLPDTPQVLTPSGGRHLYWRYTGRRVKTSAGKLGIGLDVRGDGGYVVVPPSRSNGSTYEWEGSSPDALAEPPAWLCDLVDPPQRAPAPAPAPTSVDQERARGALMEIEYRESDGRDVWLEIAMGFKAAGGDFETFEAWSSNQDGFVNTEALEKEWDSITPDGGITAGTLYYHARRFGWVWSRRPVEHASSHGADTAAATMPALEMALDRRGNEIGVATTFENVVTVLRYHEHWRGRILYNEMREAAELFEEGALTRIEDTVVLGIRLWLGTEIPWRGKPRRSDVFDAVDFVGSLQRYNPVVDYLQGVRWDRVDRLSHWLSDVCGCPSDTYHREVGTKMLIGAVARAFKPGCKLDTMTIFVGGQGLGKSTMLHALSRGHFSDTPIHIGSKEAYEALRGAWCHEFSELAGMSGRDTEKLKAYFSSPVDVYRPAYGRNVVERPRRCWFAGSTNDDAILRDHTGARRFWPVRVEGEIDVDALELVVGQLWAEAVVRYLDGETWHMSAEVAPEVAQAAEEFREVDPWEEVLAERTEGMTQVFPRQCYDWLSLETPKIATVESRRIGRIMRLLGFKRMSIRVTGRVVKGYVKDPELHQYQLVQSTNRE